MSRPRLARPGIPGLALALALALAPAGPVAAPVPAAPPPTDFSGDARLADLPARWEPLLALFDTPGFAAIVVDGDRTSLVTFGARDAAGAQPVTPETLFYVASITKTYTAATVLALVEEGRLDLDRPVRERLPRFALADPEWTAKTTARDLLSHRPGIVSPEISLLDAFTGEITDERYWSLLPQAELAEGGGPRYSNVHFTLLGRLIEAVEGRGWRETLRARILDPAGLSRTTTYASKLYADPDVAWPLERVEASGGDGGAGDGSASGWRVAEPLKTDRTMHAAGGLATTPVEAARWMRLLLDGGTTADGRRLLAEATVDAMLTVQVPLPEPDGSIRIVEGMGHAWQVGNFNGRRLAIHGGTYAGTSAFLALLPDESVGVAVLIHAGGAARGLGDIVSIDLLARLTGTEPAWDVYAAYTERARTMQAERSRESTEPAGSAETAEAAPANARRTRPPGVYTGIYGNPEWGHLVVDRDGAELAVRLGDLPLTLGPPPAEPDRLTLAALFDEPATLRFVVGADGCVERVTIEHPERGPIEFHR